MEHSIILEMKNIVKEFNGIRVLNEVSFTPVSYTHLDVYKRQV